MVRRHMPLEHHPGHRVGDVAQAGLGGLHGRLHALALRDVGADADEHRQIAGLIGQRHDGGVHPVQASRLVAVADLAMPDHASGDHLPHLREEILALHAGVQDTVILVQQFFAAVTADLAQLVIGVDDVTRQIGGADNGVLIQGKLLVRQIGECSLQVALAFLVLAHQITHQHRQGFQIVIGGQGLVGVDGRHQPPG